VSDEPCAICTPESDHNGVLCRRHANEFIARLQESNAALKQNRATIHGVVERAERAEEKNRRLTEFWEAWWAVETGVNDFDLHTQAVQRLERAESAVREMLGLPAALVTARGHPHA
jgi:hypothetical protein